MDRETIKRSKEHKMNNQNKTRIKDEDKKQTIFVLFFPPSFLHLRVVGAVDIFCYGHRPLLHRLSLRQLLAGLPKRSAIRSTPRVASIKLESEPERRLRNEIRVDVVDSPQLEKQTSVPADCRSKCRKRLLKSKSFFPASLASFI